MGAVSCLFLNFHFSSQIIGSEIPASFILENFDADVDYWPVKNLLGTFLEGAEAGSGFHPGELADLILEQHGMTDNGLPPGANGSVIALEGQEDVFGFMTVVDINRNRNKNCIQAILRYVISKAPLAERSKWSSILMDASIRIGLLVSERLANVPDPLGPMLVIQTMRELKEAGIKYDYFMVITTVFREGVDDTPSAGADESISAPKRAKPNPKPPSTSPMQYYKPEDEYLHKAASLKTSFRLLRNSQANRWTLQTFAQMSKLLLLVSQDRLPGILQELHSLEN